MGKGETHRVFLSRSPISPPFINSSVGFANKYLKMPFRENRDRPVLLEWRPNIPAMKPTHPYCYVIEYIVTMNILKTARLHRQFLQLIFFIFVRLINLPIYSVSRCGIYLYRNRFQAMCRPSKGFYL